MRKRTLIEWDDQKDRDLLQVLMPYKARARGRRLKELAQLGAMAERAGFRVVSDPFGAPRLEGLWTPSMQTVVSGSGESMGRGHPRDVPSPPARPVPRSSEHERGLDALLDSVIDL